jgi:hypothetical protein
MKRGSNCRLGRYSGKFSGWSLMMTCGVHMSERGRGITVLVREMVKWAVGSILFWAELFPFGLFYFFPFSVFLNSCIDFAF